MLKKSLIITLLSACLVIITGCQNIEDQNEMVFSRYYLTALKWSRSADILPELAKDSEILSQNESIIASWDQIDDSKKLWFNIVTFDEEELTANRKYAFMVNEKANYAIQIGETQKLRFDGELVLPEDLVNKAYTSENAKRLEVIKYIRTTFANDIKQLVPDSKELESAGMLVVQTLNSCIYPLDQSPALAVKLSDLQGLEFDHIILDKGRVRMLIEEDIVKIKIKIGSVVDDFEEHPDVEAM